MRQRNDFDKNSRFDQNSSKKDRGLFLFTPIIPHLFFTAVVLGIYYFIISNNYFPAWTDYIFWGVKIIIAFQILAAAAISFWGPIIGLLTGIGILFSIQIYNISLVTSADAWQLIVASLLGILVTLAIKM